MKKGQRAGLEVVDRKELAAVAGRLCARARHDGKDSVPLLTEQGLEGLALYLEQLCQWNAVMNLTGARSWREILSSLVADSFYLAAFLNQLPLPQAPRMWDLGAGAGLPGIPLRLVWPGGSYDMVEARQKRALFVSSVLSRLSLPDTRMFRGRAEDFFAQQTVLADGILSRAFMPWREMLSFIRPHLAPSGLAVVLALSPPEADVPQGWKLAASREYSLESGRLRWFWAFSPAEELS